MNYDTLAEDLGIPEGTGALIYVRADPDEWVDRVREAHRSALVSGRAVVLIGPSDPAIDELATVVLDSRGTVVLDRRPRTD